MAACRSCEAPIIWGLTRAGKHIPLDELPTRDGTWVLVKGLARPATDEDRKLLRPLLTVHWATCPSAEEHRRRA